MTEPVRSFIQLVLVLGAHFVLGHGAESVTIGTSSVLMADLSGMTGQEVSVPCSVDVEACGDFHSIKWYRESQRVFVFSELANLERSEGSLTNRARFDFSSNGSQSGLRISNLQLSDEGIYRCEITYLEINEGCPVVQYANLTIVAAPEYVEILQEDGRTSAAIRNVSRIGPFNEGTTVTLLCRSGGGRPVPRIEWWNGTRVLPGEMSATREESGAVTGINRLQVALTRHDLAAQWQCRVHHQARTTPLVANLHVDVHVKPANVTLTGLDAPVAEGTAVVVYCIAEGARPAASISWFNDSSPLQKGAVETSQIQPEEEEEVEENADGTFMTKSRLIFTLNRHDHRRLITCQASNPVTDDVQQKSVQASQLLRVEFAPVVTVSPENITVNESMDVLIFCTYDANPVTLTSVQWFKDDEEIVINGRDKYEGATVDQPALLLKKASRDDAGAYSCRLTNSIGSGESENVAFVAVQYAAEVRLTMDPELPVNELERPNVTLNCQVVDGYPAVLLGVRWYLDGELLKELPDCPINDSSYAGYDEDLCDVDPSKLLLEYVGRSFQGNYSCEGMNAAGWGPISDVETLIIYYPPGNTTLDYEPDLIIKDDPMLLTCGVSDMGQPSVTQYRWTRNGHVIPEISDAQWNVTQVTLNYQANYSCTPVNEAGEGETATVEVEVFAAPTFIERLPPTSGALAVAADRAKLSCRVECFPLCQIEWFRNGIPLRNSPMYSIVDTIIPENVKFNQHQSVKSTLSFNMRMWSQAKLDPAVDTANYTCTSSDNSIGEGVSSTTLFRVEYSPENAVIDRPLVEIEEGSIGGYLECLASAYPQPNYYWQYNHQIIGNGPRLALDYGLSRDKTGEYVCVAYNQHGNTSAKAFINVVYKPECSITLRESEGRTRLICEVKSNPKLVDFTWMLNNSTLTRDFVHLGTQSVLTVDGPPPASGVFYCYVNNSVGVSTPCEMNVEGGLLAKMGDDLFFFIAVISAAIVTILVVCVVLFVLCRRKQAEDKYNPSGTMEERENPEGGSTMTLQPGMNPITQHKWPLRPGVQVHVNGPNSLTLAASGSVLLAPSDQGQSCSNSSGGGSRPSSAGSQTVKCRSSSATRGKSRGATSSLVSAKQGAEDSGMSPYYETLRDKKRASSDSESSEIQPTDSGSESTRSVICVQGSHRLRNTACHAPYPTAPLPPPALQHSTVEEVASAPLAENGTVSRKRKKPEGNAIIASTVAPAMAPAETGPASNADDHPENSKFYENLPFHGLQTAPNKDSSASRPSSQMSHAASSGYGSARSTNRAKNEVVTEGVATASHRGRNSLLSSLRQTKFDSAALFRSLRVPRADPPVAASDTCTAKGACTQAEMNNSHEDGRVDVCQHPIPVPAPRYQTLGRTPHAYQNIPLPTKKRTQHDKDSHQQHGSKQTNLLTSTAGSTSMSTDPNQQQQSWKPRPATAVLSPASTRVYNNPIPNESQQQPTPHYQPIRQHPLMSASLHASDSQVKGSIVYADLSIARTTPLSNGGQNEMSPTEYAVLQFMGGGQEVQV